MKINLWVGVVFFLGLIVLATAEYFWAFVDSASLLVVSGGALCFGISASGSLFSKARLEAVSEGAVISGWIGALLGAVIIAGNVTDLEALGPAMAVMMLTVLYGYVIKAVLRMVLIARIEG